MSELSIPREFPETMRLVAEIIGTEDTIKLGNHRGGTRLYFPKRPRRDHWLVDVIGWKKFERLAWYFGGESIEIPKFSSYHLSILEDQIAARSAAGHTAADLARRYGYSERGIRKILRRVRLRTNE